MEEARRQTSGPVGGHRNYLGSSVDSANAHRRPRKIRRTGRHIAPSQVEKVAEKAGKAAPAMAIAGVLVAAAPQAHAAERTPAQATTVTEQQARTDALVKSAQPATRTYTVRSGDTLSSIAERYYHNSGDWTWIYEANKSKIRNPDSVYVGESLTIPYSAPSGTSSYTPRHAKAATQTTVLTSATSNLSGNLSCSGLEALWEAAGGSHTEAFMAAEIAMAESGGRQDALSPTNDYGYWQINGSHGPAEATFNPIGNAKAAIAISDNGHDWDPWTTYVTGAYSGRC
jgi:LysM repeat protein